MKKILYISHSSGLQGAGFALLNILQGLDRNEYDPIVVLPRKGVLYEELRKKSVSTVIIPYRMDIYPPLGNVCRDVLFIPRLIMTIIQNMIAYRKLLGFSKKNNISLIHTNTGVVHWGAKIAEKLNIPHIWHLREYQKEDFGYIPLFSRKSFVSNLSHPNNHCIAITKSVFQYHSLSKEKDIVIYDGVFSKNDLLKSPNKNVFDVRYLLFVGTLSQKKGFFDAVDAFEEIAANNPVIEFWIAGIITKRAKDRVENSKFNNRIKLLGFRRDVNSLMQNAIALLVPSYNEGFGFITAEAMMNNCIVIGRDTSGTKEQFDNGLNQTGNEIGLRFTNQTELVFQIQSAIHMDETEREQMVNNACKFLYNYTIEENIIKIESFYNKILNRK